MLRCYLEKFTLGWIMQNLNQLPEKKIEGFFNIILCLITDPARFFSQVNLEDYYEKFANNYFKVFFVIGILIAIFVSYMQIQDREWGAAIACLIGTPIVSIIVGGVKLSIALLWFNLRLKFSGVKEIDKKLSRIIWISGELIAWMIGILAFVIFYILILAIYYFFPEADEDIFTYMCIITPTILSILYYLYVEYKGIKTVFKTGSKRTFFWFVIIPILILSLRLVS